MNSLKKKGGYLLIAGIILSGCSSAPLPRQVIEQMQYSETHTGYANAAALKYALDHQIMPDSAVIAIRNGIK